MEATRHIRVSLKLCLVALGLCLAGLAKEARAAECQLPQAPTAINEVISCASPRPNTEVWRIDRPNVRQRLTTYPAIRVRKDDLVLVFAGGCVQHGGIGAQTWKRYVNPMSPSRNPDRQYFGLINLPTWGTARKIQDAVLAGGIPILNDPGTSNALSLGYQDDGYGDNGYSDHDDGWWQQCNDLPDAWVVVVIQHDCASSMQPECIRGRALDLVSDRRDANGFPLNPEWVWRRVTGTNPDPSNVCGWSVKIGGFPVDDASLCASLLTQRDGNGICVQVGTAGGIAGHMNWIGTPVAYDGWIWWEGHDYFWDDDYTFNIAALNDWGSVSPSLFVSGQHNPQMEFDSSETIDQFTGAPWWTSFHSAVDTEDESRHTANAIVTGARMPADFFPGGTEGLVVGQLGLDCAHACGAELHPAWAVFIHVKDDPRDDTWAFFVRNWGDEGFCSEKDHQTAAMQPFSVRFEKPGATGVTVRVPETVIGMTQALAPPSVVLAPGGGAAIATFQLPPPSSHGLVYGELHLSWQRTLSPFLLSELTRRAIGSGLSEARLRELTSRARSPEDAASIIEEATRRQRMAKLEALRARSADESEQSVERVLTRRLEAQPPENRQKVRSGLRSCATGRGTRPRFASARVEDASTLLEANRRPARTKAVRRDLSCEVRHMNLLRRLVPASPTGPDHRD